MAHWIDRVSDPEWRAKVGRRFEGVTQEAFTLFRWTLLVGFAQYLALNTASAWFDALFYTMAALLFGYLAAIFLLRPEIPVFKDRSARWKRLLQTALNYLICMGAFMALLAVIDALVEASVTHRFAL